jgi:hypothetical protein
MFILDLDLTLSTAALDARRAQARISLEEVLISIPSDLTKYSCEPANLCTASFIRNLISKNLIPFGKASTRQSIYDLVDLATTIDEIKYKKCDSRYCGDWDWDGKSLNEELRTRMEQFDKILKGLCVRCFKSEGTTASEHECCFLTDIII